MKYIDVEKLKDEINNRLMAVDIEKLGNFGCHRVWAYNDVKDLINSLQQEQPKVDIEKELEEAVRMYKPNGDFGWGTLYNIAYHFYELGQCNARKEE